MSLNLTCLEIFFSVPLKHAFGDATEGAYQHTRSVGKLVSLVGLKAKSKV